MLSLELVLAAYSYRDGVLYHKRNKGLTKLGAAVGWKDKLGYLYTDFIGTRYPVHALVWYFHYGKLPTYIDHIDGNPTNNSISNLREATHSENMRNTRLSKRNTSGHKGVSWDKKKQAWAVRVRVYERYKFFGYHDDLEFAALVAQEVRRKHHGAFANDGHGLLV